MREPIDWFTDLCLQGFDDAVVYVFESHAVDGDAAGAFEADLTFFSRLFSLIYTTTALSGSSGSGGVLPFTSPMGAIRLFRSTAWRSTTLSSSRGTMIRGYDTSALHWKHEILRIRHLEAEIADMQKEIDRQKQKAVAAEERF